MAASRGFRRVARALLLFPVAFLFAVALVPSPARAVSCSFFALTDDQTQIGPPPLTVHFFSIHAIASDLNEWDGLVRFEWQIGGSEEPWQETGVLRMQGAGATPSGFDLTFEQPGEYPVRLRCTHLGSSSTFTTEPQTIVVQGPGGFSDPLFAVIVVVAVAVPIIISVSAAARRRKQRRGVQAGGPAWATGSGPGPRYEQPPQTVTCEIPPSQIAPGALPNP